MKRYAALLTLLAAAILSFSCYNGQAQNEPSPNTPPVSRTEDSLSNQAVQAPAPWGTVKGKIIWGADKVPAAGTIALPADNPATAECVKANKGVPPPDEKWIVNPKNKGIKNTFVWLADFDDPRSKKPLPTHASLKEIKVKEIVIDQPACHFIPHAIALREGQVLVVKNSAPFQHNFKWTGHPDSNPGGNVLLPAAAMKNIDNLVADRFPVQIECNIHPWMRGWLRVYSHPYYAVTDDNGAFEFKNAPAGQYRIMVWHGSAGWRGGVKGAKGDPIQIPADGTLDLGELKFTVTE